MVTMGNFVNPTNEAFQVALNSKIYVDKTSLLEYTNSVLGTVQGYICNSRPRRFGKSYAANMLTAYYSKGCDSEAMFSNLKIGQSLDFKKHLNQYDVIHFDVQWCMAPAGGADNVIAYMEKTTIEELREYYPDVLPEGIRSLPEALARINGRTGAKFVIIIDEWDVLIRDEANNQKIQDEYINFLRGLFKGVEPTKYIKLAYLTGILPIKKLKTQSALNNFDEYTMLGAGALAPYIGFTEEEVRGLCEQYGQNFEEVRHWYDGYYLGKYHVYNPRAVVCLMLNGDFRSYWSATSSYEVITPLISMDFDGLRSSVIEMLSGNSVEVDVTYFKNDMVNFESKDDIITYMIHLGYFAYEPKYKKAYIPNEEIREELLKVTRKKKWNEFLQFQQESSELLEATLDMDVETVAESIEKIHTEYASTIQYNNENSLSSVLTIGYLSAMQYYFKPIREYPTGRGFADFVFIPKPDYEQEYPVLVVELKWNKNAKTALEQIKEKKYPESVSRYAGEMLLVGINYDKKTKEHRPVPLLPLQKKNPFPENF